MITLTRSSTSPYYFISGNVEPATIRVLRRELSYIVMGYERTDAFKNGSWDGREYLVYKTKKGVFFFPAGLIDRATSVLDSLDLEYQIEEARRRDSEYGKLGLEWHGPALRPYQQQAVIDCFNHGCGVISIPTGGGKTMIMMRLMYIYDMPSIVIVHRKELVRQWENNIKDVLGVDAGIVNSSKKDFQPISIAMMQTLSKMDTHLEYPVVFFDESHVCPCDTAYKIASNINATYRFGASATPYRTDGADLKIWACVGEICSNVTPTQLIDMGYIAKPKFIFLKPPMTYNMRGWKYNDVYVSGIVTNEGRNQMIVDNAIKYANEGHTVLVSCDRIDHMEILNERIPTSVSLQGKDKDKYRKDVLEKFESGEIQILVSTLLKEGVDIKNISCFINSAAGKSSVAAIQRIGRALRVAPGKTEAIIIDFEDWQHKFLSSHWEERYNTYKSTFEDYCP